MQALYRYLGWYTNFLMFLAGIALVGMMLHVTVDVISKAFLGTAIIGTLEVVTYYYMVAVVFLPIALVQRKRAQIVIDVMTENLAPRPHAWVDTFAGSLSFLYVLGLTWYGALHAARMTAIGEHTIAIMVPFSIWPARWLVVASGVAISLHLLIQTLNDLLFAATGRRLVDETAVQETQLELHDAPADHNGPARRDVPSHHDASGHRDAPAHRI